MENLNDTGINLRKINVSEYTTMVEDLDYNFSVILSSPVFKGMPGQEGQPGTSTSGERGSRWFWAIWEDFKVAYGLTNQTQVNLNFINGQLTSNLVKLLNTLKTDSIISNDNIVLPSGMIITFDITLGKFKDSGTSFAQAQGISEDRVAQMINNAISGINEGTLIWEVFKAYAKNFPDSSVSGTNNQVNPDSVLDVGTPNSKPGYLMDRHKFISLATANMNTVQDSATFIFGAAELYHSLIQRTQNAVGRTTNEYAPGVDDSTVLAVLQDNYKNGIIVGYKDATTVRDFSRIYRDTNSLHLTSGYSVYENEFGEVIIREDVITLRTKDMLATSMVDVKSNFRVIGKARFMDDIIHTAFEVLKAQNIMNLGIPQSGMSLGQTYKIDFKESPTFSSIPSMTFLGTDAVGKVKGSGYSITQSVNGSSTSIQIPTAAAVMAAINTLNGGVAADIAALNSSVNVLNNTTNLLKRDSLQFRNVSTVPSDASLQGIYRVDSGNSPNGSVGYIMHLVDTSTLIKTQIAVTANGILYRSAAGTLTGVAWNRAATSAELTTLSTTLTNRLNGHDADIASLSTTINNNYTTLNNKIDTVNTTLTNSIATNVSTLRTETIAAIQGIQVGTNITKSIVGNSISIGHQSFNTILTQDNIPTRLITALTVSNGHLTEIKWTPFSVIGELQYGMVIDLIAFYRSPSFYWWLNNSLLYNTWSTVYNQYFDVNGKGKTDVQLVNPTTGGNLGTINISKFVLCDGRNMTPNLTGVTLIGAGNYAALDNNGRPVETLLSGIAPFVPTNALSNGAGNLNIPLYGLSKRSMTTDELPTHNHGIGGVGGISTNPYGGGYGGGTTVAGYKTQDAGGGQPTPMMQLSFATFKIMFTG